MEISLKWLDRCYGADGMDCKRLSESVRCTEHLRGLFRIKIIEEVIWLASFSHVRIFFRDYVHLNALILSLSPIKIFLPQVTCFFLVLHLRNVSLLQFLSRAVFFCPLGVNPGH